MIEILALHVPTVIDSAGNGLIDPVPGAAGLSALLMAIGFFLKNMAPWFKWHGLIPTILLVVGVSVTLLFTSPITYETAILGLLSVFGAVGAYESAKGTTEHLTKPRQL
jgi:hypothetical protein